MTGRVLNDAQLVLTGLLVAAVMTGACRAAYGETRLDFQLAARVEGSDNINRTASGSEESGRIFSYSFGPRIRVSEGDRSLDVLVLGGVERVRSTVDETNSTYQATAGYRAGRDLGSYFEVSASAVRRTDQAGEDELERGRRLREERGFRVGTGRRNPGGASWGVEAGADHTEAGDDVSDETSAAVEMTRSLSQRSRLALDVSAVDGDSAANGNIWRRYSAGFEITRQKSERSTIGFGADWVRNESDPGSGIEITTDVTGVDFSISTRWSELDNFTGRAGYEVVSTDGGSDGGYRADLGYDRALVPRWRLSADGGHGLRFATEADGTVTSNRQTAVSVALTWDVAQRAELRAETAYTQDVLLDDTGAETRTDDGHRAALGGRWNLGRGLEANLLLQSEKIDSTEIASQLEEDRFEIQLIGTI